MTGVQTCALPICLVQDVRQLLGPVIENLVLLLLRLPGLRVGAPSRQFGFRLGVHIAHAGVEIRGHLGEGVFQGLRLVLLVDEGSLSHVNPPFGT